MSRSPEIDGFVYEQLAQRIVFGWGRRREIAAEADRFSTTSVLLISERSTRHAAEEIGGLLGGRVVATISQVRPHVPSDDVRRATSLAVTADVDLVVIVGGGSATGLGKAVILEHGAPLLAIPTTYAGSEVTPIYGITESSRKQTGRDERVLPRTVIYDPELTTTLPARVTASTGMNALAHCVEGLCAANVSPVARVLALESIRALARALPACVTDPSDKPGRTEALYGAYLAGTVLASTGMAIHHRICHVLGGSFGMNHGDVNAVVLPHAVAFNEPAARDGVALVAGALEGSSAATALFDLSASLGAPSSLKELGMNAADLQRAASLVVQGNFYNPRPASLEDVLGILEAAYDGRRPDDDDEKGKRT